MIISKLTLVLCALAIGALCLTVRAEDNPAQAAARMALAKQQFEQNAQPATNAPAPAAKPTPPVKSKKARAEKPVAAPQPKPAAQAPAVVARPAPEPAPASRGDNSAQAAARMALGQQLGMPTTPSPVANNTGVTTPESTPAAKPVPAPPVLLYTPTSPDNNNYVGQDIGLKPIVAPGLPINTSKQARLQALLERYKADQITPEEYHKQRAAILAEP